MKRACLIFGFISLFSAIVSGKAEEMQYSTSAVCYSGLFPEFIHDSKSKYIGFRSYALIGERSGSHRCEEKYTITNFYDVDAELSNDECIKLGDSSSEWGCIEAKIYPEAVKVDDEKNVRLSWRKTRLPGAVTLEASYTLYGETNKVKLREDFETQSSYRLSANTNLKVMGIESDRNELVTEFEIAKNGWSAKDLNNRSIKYSVSELPFVTANGCWMIVPLRSDVNLQENRLYEHRIYYLEVYSLKNVIDDQKRTLCTNPEYVADPLVAPLGRKKTIVEISNNTNEGTVLVGLDYVAYSPLESSEMLHIVFQTGFEKNGDGERYQEGNLVLQTVIRSPSGDGSISLKKQTNITENCFLGGVVYQPTFSSDKNQLFFLARNKKGDDKSKSNLYAVSMDDILDSQERGEDFRCYNITGMSKLSNLTGDFQFYSKREIDYPIQKYELDYEMKRLTITYEEHGESVVRFYKYDKINKKIVYEYPYTINGVGKIYDVAKSYYTDSIENHPSYFILHSRLDAAVGMSRCYFVSTRYVCGERDNQIFSSTMKMHASRYDGDKQLSKVSLNRINVNRNWGIGGGIDVFVLEPSSPNGKAVISIHGGPNEAWDGRFSPRDYRLAQLGYTMYMPNPLGSTGYGFALTDAGDHNWGGAIYRDIVEIVNYVGVLKERGIFTNLFVKGYSFGGYIVNWIQTKRHKLVEGKIDAMIAVNALYDLRNFAASTDQLWFSQYHLKCSGWLDNPIKDCREIECNSINRLIYPVLIDQNPACNEDTLGDLPIPTLFISGREDQRVPFDYNVIPMIKRYRETSVPYTIQVEKFRGHEFPPYRLLEQGHLIDDWLTNVEKCKEFVDKQGVDIAACKYVNIESKLSPYFKDRDEVQCVFDNSTFYTTVSGLVSVNIYSENKC